MTAKTKEWSFSTGEKGTNRVRAFTKNGYTFLEFYEPRGPLRELARKRISLGRCSEEAAKAKAEEVSALFRKQEAPRSGQLTLRALFDIYLAEVTPTKGKETQSHDQRALELFLRCAGPGRNPEKLSRRDWARFIQGRRSGKLRPPKSRFAAGVRDRVIESDLKTVLAVLNWATQSRDDDGQLLLERNPLKGLELPKEQTPIRRLFTGEQYKRLLELAKDPVFKRAVLIGYHTGHRNKAVRHLSWEDLDPSTDLIRWQGQYDKVGLEHHTPYPIELKALLEPERPADGVWVCPAPESPTEPCGRNTMMKWMQRALKELGIAGKRYGWHSLRRQFATDLKDTPLPDLCALGGWKESRTLLTCYIQPDMGTMRAALAGRRPLG